MFLSIIKIELSLLQMKIKILFIDSVKFLRSYFCKAPERFYPVYVWSSVGEFTAPVIHSEMSWKAYIKQPVVRLHLSEWIILSTSALAPIAIYISYFSAQKTSRLLLPHR